MGDDAMFRFRRGVGAALAVGVLSGLCGFASGDAVEEKFPDGTVKAKYTTDSEGRRTGAYAEFHPNGKAAIKAAYAEGVLNGNYAEYHDNGAAKVAAIYRKGKLNGRLVETTAKGALVRTAFYKDGVPDGLQVAYEGGRAAYSHLYKDGLLLSAKGPDGVPVTGFTRGAEQIRRRLAEIAESPLAGVPPPGPVRPPGFAVPKAKVVPAKTKAAPGADADVEADRLAALRRLRAYRYLSELPYEDLTLDDLMNRHAAAGARLCEKIGRLDHTPANPGLPEAEYKFAYKGTSSCNLHQGQRNSARSVDGYMDDSDPGNIGHLGHRRWCMNPAMVRTGFGFSGGYCAMWSFDASRAKVPDYDYFAYPARGYMPAGFFGDRHAWSLSLNPLKYGPPQAAGLNIRVFETDDQSRPVGEPLMLDHTSVHASDGNNYGGTHIVIFRPAGVSAKPGKRYWVAVDGLREPQRKGPAPIRYIVEFVSDEPPAAKE